MIIGTMFLGKVKEINKQHIETKFFVFGIPIFPTSSMLVTESGYNRRQGMSIPLNTTSIVAGYARLLTFVAAIVFLFMGYGESSLTLQLIGVAFAGLWVYLYFWFGKPTPSEIEERSKLGNAIGFYAMPNWFDFDTALNNYKNLQYHYKDKFQNSDWKEDLNGAHIDADKRPVLYAIALFNFMVDQSPENERLFNKANSIYK